jgi:hypothetical protein
MNRTRRVVRARRVVALRPEDDARLATEVCFSAESRAGMHALVDQLTTK